MMSSHDVYVAITLETAALDRPNKVAILVTDAPAKRAPTFCPLWKSDVSHFAVLFDIWYICPLQLGFHPVAAVQYTFKHKQYTEQHN